MLLSITAIIGNDLQSEPNTDIGSTFNGNHPIFLIKIKAISKFQKAWYTLSRSGKTRTDGYRHRKAPETSPLLRCSSLIAAQAIAQSYQLKHCFPQKNSCEVPRYSFVLNNDAKVLCSISYKKCLQALQRTIK